MVCRPALSPLSHTGPGSVESFDYALVVFQISAYLTLRYMIYWQHNLFRSILDYGRHPEVKGRGNLSSRLYGKAMNNFITFG